MRPLKCHFIIFRNTDYIMLIKKIKLLLAIVIISSLSACATQANRDPLQGFNRGVYKFNDVADKAIAKPVAKAYKFITPTPIRTGISNFFANLGTFTSVFNNILQFKIGNAMSEAGRFVINSTVGLAGFIDVAAMDKIPVHKEDFGLTLGHWGLGQGAYLVLPVLGPSTLRDTTGFAVDTLAFNLVTYQRNMGHIAVSNVLLGTGLINTRTNLLDASDIMDEAALDPYAFMRDAYLQRRENQFADGDASKQKNSDDGSFEPLPEDVKK